MKTFASLRAALDEYLTSHLDGLENEQRVEALAWYCQGLGFEVEAKSTLGLAGNRCTSDLFQRGMRDAKLLRCSTRRRHGPRSDYAGGCFLA